MNYGMDNSLTFKCFDLFLRRTWQIFGYTSVFNIWCMGYTRAHLSSWFNDLDIIFPYSRNISRVSRTSSSVASFTNIV